MDCPICGAEAKNDTPGDFDGLVVACNRCGAFEITDGVMNTLIRLDFAGRKAALEKAKATVGANGGRAIIDQNCLSL